MYTCKTTCGKVVWKFQNRNSYFEILQFQITIDQKQQNSQITWVIIGSVKKNNLHISSNYNIGEKIADIRIYQCKKLSSIYASYG